MFKLTRSCHRLIACLMAAAWLFACALIIAHECAGMPSLAGEAHAAAHVHAPSVQDDPASSADAGAVCAQHCQTEQTRPGGWDMGASLTLLILCAGVLLYGPLSSAERKPTHRAHSYLTRPFRPPLSILYQRFNN